METLTKILEKSDGKIFKNAVKGNNFMTPDLIGFYSIPNGEAELTTGRFMGDDIYGVTVVQNGSKQDDLSKCCHSLSEAHEYIKSL